MSITGILGRSARHTSSCRLGRGNSTALAWGVALLLGATGCGSSYPESEYPSKPPPGVTQDPLPPEPPPPGTIWRSEVLDVLDAGLGAFLQRVEVEPEKVNGAFVGFRIAALKPASWWQGIDVAVGDVVTAVNDMPIEQPAQAHAAFESLRTADQLVVRYLRGGDTRELTYRIRPRPEPKAP